MVDRKRIKQKMLTRRQFIQTGSAATAGLLLAACGADTLTGQATSTGVVVTPTGVVAQSRATNTSVPAISTPSPTDTLQPDPTKTLQPGETNPPTVESSNTATNTPTLEPTPDGEKVLIAGMVQAATRFLEVLDPGQYDKATYAFSDDERFRWHWTTPGRFPRNGLPLREMNEAQKARALALLEASLSSMGFEKALNIISLQQDLGNDPELYYVTIFGAPGTGEPWGWRWEGHHLSRQFTVVNERVAMTPFFLGSWPTTTEAGLRAMASEEDAALEIINSLTGSAREAAIIQAKTFTQHITQNAAQVGPLDPVGISFSDLAAAQQQLVATIIQAYVGTLPENIAAPSLARINSAGLEQIRFGWAGSLDYQRPQYYRIQGPTFLLEYDNSRNGGTHIHSVWRDFERDFGYHLL